MARAHNVGSSTVRLAILVAVLVGSIGQLVPAQAEPDAIGALHVGDSIFWEGPFIETAGVRPPLEPYLCHGATGSTFGCIYTSVAPGTAPLCIPGSCIKYGLDVLDNTGVLRVALDHPTSNDSMSLVLVDPAGVPAPVWAWNIGTFSVEARVPDPADGRWTIQVLLHSVQRSSFRMRAFLQPPTMPGGSDALLPNLQVNPPFDLTFDGCQATETILYAPGRCLRFSSGPHNVGSGPLDLRIRELGVSGPEVQVIHHADGSTTERAAGTFEYHAAHGHYHHVGTAGFQLFRVTDPSTGAMEKVGAGPKIGFCMADAVIADWTAFAQEAQGARSGECNGRVIGPPIPQIAEPVLGMPMFGLSTGWGDVYTYAVEGNYVDFETAGDGSYVIQSATDPDDTILEENEADNLGYTYFTVTSDSIAVLERGRGLSPWDPAKSIVDDQRRGAQL